MIGERDRLPRYPAGALNIKVFDVPHWRAMCVPLPVVRKLGSKSIDLCGGKIVYKVLQATDAGDWYWIFLVDISDTHIGKSVDMPEGWDFRKFMR